MSVCDILCDLNESELFENDHFTPLHLTEKKDFRFIKFLPSSILPPWSSPTYALSPPLHSSSAYLNPSSPLPPSFSLLPLSSPSPILLSSAFIYPSSSSLLPPSSSSLLSSLPASPSSSNLPAPSFDYEFEEDLLELGDDGQSVSTMEILPTKFLTDFRKIYKKKIDKLEVVKLNKEPLFYEHKFSGLVFGTIPYNKFIEHLTFIYKGLKYIGRYMDFPNIQDIENRKVYLPHLGQSTPPLPHILLLLPLLLLLLIFLLLSFLHILFLLLLFFPPPFLYFPPLLPPPLPSLLLSSCLFLILFILRLFLILDGKKKTLFLDLDETLVHTIPLDEPHEAEFTMTTKQGVLITVIKKKKN